MKDEMMGEVEINMKDNMVSETESKMEMNEGKSEMMMKLEGRCHTWVVMKLILKVS